MDAGPSPHSDRGLSSLGRVQRAESEEKEGRRPGRIGSQPFTIWDSASSELESKLKVRKASSESW